MAPKRGVYEAIFTGLMKIFLIASIGALSLGKFAGFEWLRIQSHHIEPMTRVQSIRDLLDLLTGPCLESYVWTGVAALVYIALGLLRIPGQTLAHVCVGYVLGVTWGFPACLAAYTTTSCALFMLAKEYAQGNSVEVYFEHAARLDVFALKISQQKYQLFVDKDGQKVDQKQLRAVADKGYLSRIRKAAPEPEHWEEWSAWDNERFMYMIWARVFPLSTHWLLNLASGLLHNKGITFPEFIASTILGNIPCVFLAVSLGQTQRDHSLTQVIMWPWTKWILIVGAMSVPGILSTSGVLEKYAKKKEFGWGPEDDLRKRNAD